MGPGESKRRNPHMVLPITPLDWDHHLSKPPRGGGGAYTDQPRLPPPPPKERWAIARVHKRQSAQSAERNHLAEVVRSKPGRQAGRRAGVYRGKRHIPPILGLFAYPTPRGRIVSLTPCKIIILSNKRIPQ